MPRLTMPLLLCLPVFWLLIIILLNIYNVENYVWIKTIILNGPDGHLQSLELGPHFVLVAQGSQHLRLLHDFTKLFLRRNYTKPQFYPLVEDLSLEFHEGWYVLSEGGNIKKFKCSRNWYQFLCMFTKLLPAPSFAGNITWKCPETMTMFEIRLIYSTQKTSVGSKSN